MCADPHPSPPLPSRCADRAGTHSRKVQGAHGSYVGRDVVPMWVADMDFEAPQPIRDAVVERAQHAIFGYTDPPERLIALALERLSKLYASAEAAEASWLRWLPGLICGLHHAVRATCDAESDRVVICTPIYPPFLDSVTSNRATLVTVPLLEGGAAEPSKEIRFEIDWPALERQLSHADTKLLHFCNP